MGLPAPMKAAFLALLVAAVGAQEAQWLELEARPDLEPHMHGSTLGAPYFDCQCSLDMKCLCDKTDDFTDSFLEERADETSSDSGSGSGSGSDTPPATPDLDKASSEEPPTENATLSDAKGNETADPPKLEHNPDWDKPRPYYIDPKQKVNTAGCGKPACMKVDIFCANKKKSSCQLKGECCWKARKEMQWLRKNEDDAYKKQKAKSFEEFQDLYAAEGKLWKRVSKLNLWRRKGEIREKNERAMEVKEAEYDQKLAQLQAAIDKRMAEKATLETWKAGRVAYFASRMGQMAEYEKMLESLKAEIEEDRKEAVADFKANEQRMDDYLANSEAAFKSREDKIVGEQEKLKDAQAASKAAKDEQAAENVEYMKSLEAREKDGTGPMPVTAEARDGKMPKKASEEKKPEEKKA